MEKENKVVHRLSINNVSPPVGNYTHVTKISSGAEFYTFSGQIGTDMNGKLPDDYNKQVDNTFFNISELLKNLEMTPDNVIKVNIWSIEEIDWDYFYGVYDKMFGKVSPSMTVAYISALGTPEIKLEIEIWAAK